MEQKRKEWITLLKKNSKLKLIYKICTIACIALLTAAIILIYIQPSNIVLNTTLLLIVLLLMITSFVLFNVLMHYKRKFAHIRDEILYNSFNEQ